MESSLNGMSYVIGLVAYVLFRTHGILDPVYLVFTILLVSSVLEPTGIMLDRFILPAITPQGLVGVSENDIGRHVVFRPQRFLGACDR